MSIKSAMQNARIFSQYNYTAMDAPLILRGAVLYQVFGGCYVSFFQKKAG